MKDVIIIGGGAAGITAGIYAARKYLDVLLISKDFTGQIGYSAWVENYPGFKKISGLNLIKNFKDHLDHYDVSTKSFEEIRSIEIIENGFRIITDENSYQAKSVIIASGSLPKKLNAKNEETYIGRGLSYCLTCDETYFKNKKVAVVGGGNAGMEAAIELSGLCPKVYVLEFGKDLTADEILQVRAKKLENIQIITSAEVKSFHGNRYLNKMTYHDLLNDVEMDLEVDGCLVQIGARPNTGFLQNFLILNQNGEIEVDPVSLETNIKGVFAAGDATNTRNKQIVVACGQGAIASLSAYRYINNLI